MEGRFVADRRAMVELRKRLRLAELATAAGRHQASHLSHHVCFHRFCRLEMVDQKKKRDLKSGEICIHVHRPRQLGREKGER